MSEMTFERFLDSIDFVDCVALDIGANHGVYTTKIADRFSKVYAFEPHTDNLKILKQSANAPNITIVEKAISDKTGKLKLFCSHSNPGGHSISEKVSEVPLWGHAPDRFVEVDGISIDDFCKGMNVGFMKVDVEGAENFIFNGAVETLKNNKMDIMLEVHQTVDIDELYMFFRNLEYIWYEGGKPIRSINVDNHYILSNK